MLSMIHIFQELEHHKASEPQFQCSYQGHQERKKPITTQWNETVSQINDPVFVHSWGHILSNGTKVKKR